VYIARKNSLKRKLPIYIFIILLIAFYFIKGFFGEGNKSNSFPDRNERFRNISHLILTKHARCRMDCRNISLNEIKEIIQDGKWNKNKSGIGSKGDSTFALEGMTRDNQEIRVVVSPTEKGLVVITCIDLKNEWSCNCN
jgi:hypothetical protein